MRHCDDEVLAALALGEPVDASDAAHVDSCETCAREVAELRELQGTLVDAGTVGPLVAPPDGVWEGIDARVAAEDEADDPSVVPLTAGRRPRRVPDRTFAGWVVGAAAAVGVVIGGAVVALALRDSGPEQSLVATAELADLATEEDAGTALVERRDDGTEVLVIDTAYVPAAEGSLEVWLIDPDVVGMVSLGFLTGDHAEFEIPAGYDVASFPIVDISVEPADGDPTHSGDSITRGILEG
ncbi:anti-sigma factor [Demequina rhizosphaerae]|uniref:anti-sigma factor n=1 Tax=Demequina rhizosphaerae TaxID=1638985 RepID=UPI0007858056|nr:anti-sigma factor [Demequina rhizosphaerae]